MDYASSVTHAIGKQTSRTSLAYDADARRRDYNLGDGRRRHTPFISASTSCTLQKSVMSQRLFFCVFFLHCQPITARRHKQDTHG